MANGQQRAQQNLEAFEVWQAEIQQPQHNPITNDSFYLKPDIFQSELSILGFV
ncbi:hypothetical protein [Acinetobacter towneri]|uniref:hypothetical protein n=1 Tax=Acinetobacter towneri TaxID=202956 RepID=UPI001F40E0CB|nr:hypothetical protein [Acinetobacter towneri]UIP25667.1 hypothetical protein LZG54_02770 [Acinetobacter towneri]